MRPVHITITSCRYKPPLSPGLLRIIVYNTQSPVRISLENVFIMQIPLNDGAYVILISKHSNIYGYMHVYDYEKFIVHFGGGATAWNFETVSNSFRKARQKCSFGSPAVLLYDLIKPAGGRHCCNVVIFVSTIR